MIKAATALPAALSLALLSLAGCMTTHFEAPRLTVAAVQVVSADLWQQRLRVRLHVQNPNDAALPVKSIEYNLELAGQPFASGAADASFVVPARGEADFDTTVTTNVAGVLLQLMSRGSNPAETGVDYHFSGRISLAAGWLRPLPFDERGTIKLQ